MLPPTRDTTQPIEYCTPLEGTRPFDPFDARNHCKHIRLTNVVVILHPQGPAVRGFSPWMYRSCPRNDCFLCLQLSDFQQ